MKKLVLLSLAVVAIAALLIKQGIAGENDGLFSPVVPQETITGEDVRYSAWLPWWDEDKALASLEKNEGKLEIILPYWFELSREGDLREIRTELKKEIMAWADNNQVEVWPMVANEFDGRRVTEFLQNEEERQSFVEDLVKLAKVRGYTGWDLDWEQISPEDRDNFTGFVEMAERELEGNNIGLSVTVHAQTGSRNDWVGSAGQDLAAIGRSADAVRVMIYDFHNGVTEPGPVTPLDYLEKVVRYSQEMIPREKLIVALPVYGYDWKNGGADAVTFEQAEERLAARSVPSTRDDMSFSLRAEYEDNGYQREIWYEDAVSVIKKVAVSRRLGVNRFCFWRLGGEDPEIWEKL